VNKIGLIGKKLEHSRSPELFKNLFEKEKDADWNYGLYEIEDIKKITKLIKKEKLQGFNVTIPYKESILSLLKKVSDEAKAVGAVNTVKITEEGLVGYNTDVYGFERLIWINDAMPKNALILGTGGASKAVQYVFSKLKIHFEIVSRTPSRDTILYEDLDGALFSEFDTIVNTTPLGMFPEIMGLPNVPYSVFNKKMTAIDLVYNPEETLFLGLAGANGSRTINGLQMLQFQAEKAWDIFKAKKSKGET
jgi:shikimate dehydrogenase